MLCEGCSAPRIAGSISERPRTSAFARWQVAQDSPSITTLHGRTVPITSKLARQLVLEFDGESTIAQVAARLGEKNPSERDQGMITQDSVRQGAEQLLKYGILVS